MNPDGALLLRLADTVGADPSWESVEEAVREVQALNERLSDLLERAADELRGPPPELTRWSWHDVPDLAGRAIALLQTEPLLWAEWVARLDGDSGYNGESELMPENPGEDEAQDDG